MAGKLVMAGLVLPLAALTHAEVTLDGTLGPRDSVTGPHYQIPDTAGRTVGSNLFHSFEVFNIDTGESATFTGPASIGNVISRVTGGSRSLIDGPLRSEIGGANFWFINPSGVLFGPNASLDVQGSLHVSSADYLRLGEGGRFDATHPENTVLTSAPPEAFGFLGHNPGPIAMSGGELEVPRGKTLGLVGGDITLSGGRLSAPGGRVGLASVNSAGEIPAEATPDAGSSARLGRIRITKPSEDDLASVEAESVFIKSGEFTLANTEVVADGSISVSADTLHLSEGARLRSDPAGSGKAGRIAVDTHGALLEGEDTGLFAQGGAGNGGDVAVAADRLTVRDGAAIGVSTFGAGRGGDVRVKAETVQMEGRGTGLFASAGPGSTGDAGNLTVEADRLTMRDGAVIRASTAGAGRGGHIAVRAGAMRMEGVPTGIFAEARAGSTGDAGDLEINAGHLRMQEGAQMSVSTFADGNGGRLEVRAATLHLEGVREEEPTGLFAQATTFGRTGNAGELVVNANRLTMQDGSAISVSTFGAGKGGNLTVTADTMRLEGVSGNHRTGLFASAGPGSTGDAGGLTVVADRLTLRDGAVIRAANFGPGRGGHLRIRGAEMFLEGAREGLRTGLFTSAEVSSTGDAGDLTVEADRLTMRDSAAISVSTSGIGKGGSLRVRAATMHLEGIRDDVPTGLYAQGSAGDGGDMAVDASCLTMRDGAAIGVSTFGAGHGGDLRVRADTLRLEGGREGHPTGLFASAGPGSTGNAGNLTVDAGGLTMRDGAVIRASTFGPGRGGDLGVRAGTLFLEGMRGEEPTGLFAQGNGGGGGNVEVYASRLTMRDGAAIGVSTFGAGRGGDLRVRADTLRLEGGREGHPTGLFASAGPGSTGNAGNLTVDAGGLTMRDGAVIRASTFGPGRGGDLGVRADTMRLEGGRGKQRTGLFASAGAGSRGDAGNIRIKADRLELRDGAEVSAGTYGRGSGGRLSVEADTLRLSGVGTGIGSLAAAGSEGDAGGVTVQAGSLVVGGGAAISTTTLGRGDGGRLSVKADRLLLSGDGGTKFAGIVSDAASGSRGNAGDLTVRARNLEMRNGAVISASTRGIGKGGNVRVTAADIMLRDRASIAARSTGSNSGVSGKISVTAADALCLFDGSRISVQSEGADAGHINLAVGNLLHLRDQGSITTSAAGGAGRGGNIAINSDFVVLDQGSNITADALKGQAGNIFIRILGGGSLFQSPDSLIRASSAFGVDGSVVVDAPDTDITAGLPRLPANFLDAASVLTERCAEHSSAHASSFVVRKYEGLPDSPYAPRDSKKLQQAHH